MSSTYHCQSTRVIDIIYVEEENMLGGQDINLQIAQFHHLEIGDGQVKDWLLGILNDD